HQHRLTLVNDRPVFLVSNGNSNGVFAKDLLLVYLDENGSFAWPEQTRQVSTNPSGVKSRIQINRPFEGRVVAAWAEDRPDSSFIRPYAQRVDVDLACVTPTAGFGYSTDSLTVTFINIALQVDSIVWDFGDGTQGTGAEPVHTYTSDGQFTVCEYVFNECGTDVFCRDLVISTIGTSDLEKWYDLKISPNPSRGPVNILLTMPSAGSLHYKVYTTNGQLLESQTLNLSSGKQAIPLKGLPEQSGTYFVFVQIGNSHAVIRVIR
ncbi:MAG: T9SS type A sorting domain-containing protein, partial [Saprospiraceae bacterium]|nr:T9SS type A sorting domain-containing protein [Saprospiraceae bacterium]